VDAGLAGVFVPRFLDDGLILQLGEHEIFRIQLRRIHSGISGIALTLLLLGESGGIIRLRRRTRSTAHGDYSMRVKARAERAPVVPLWCGDARSTEDRSCVSSDQESPEYDLGVALVLRGAGLC
jgi:hypothetical protein